MPCLLPQKSKTSGSSPSPHREGKKKTQRKRNNIMKPLPPSHTPQSLHQVNRGKLSSAEPEDLHLICMADKAPRRARAAALQQPPQPLPAAEADRGLQNKASFPICTLWHAPSTLCDLLLAQAQIAWGVASSILNAACFLLCCPSKA